MQQSSQSMQLSSQTMQLRPSQTTQLGPSTKPTVGSKDQANSPQLGQAKLDTGDKTKPGHTAEIKPAYAARSSQIEQASQTMQPDRLRPLFSALFWLLSAPQATQSIAGHMTLRPLHTRGTRACEHRTRRPNHDDTDDNTQARWPPPTFPRVDSPTFLSSSTPAPPGCSLANLLRSYTAVSMMIQRSPVELCCCQRAKRRDSDAIASLSALSAECQLGDSCQTTLPTLATSSRVSVLSWAGGAGAMVVVVAMGVNDSRLR